MTRPGALWPTCGRDDAGGAGSNRSPRRTWSTATCQFATFSSSGVPWRSPRGPGPGCATAADVAWSVGDGLIRTSGTLPGQFFCPLGCGPGAMMRQARYVPLIAPGAIRRVGQTIDDWPTVLFQKRHFIELAERLRRQGHHVAPLDFDVGDKPLDKFIDLPPYEWNCTPYQRDTWKSESLHLKVTIDGFACTCFGTIIRKS